MKAWLLMMIFMAIIVSAQTIDDQLRELYSTPQVTIESNYSVASDGEIRSTNMITGMASAINSFFTNTKNSIFSYGYVVIGSVFAVIIVLIAVYIFLNRNAPDNNLRKARKYHRKAEKLNEQGKFEQSKKYYEKSNSLRQGGNLR